MADNRKMQQAKAAKNDEFYTEYRTISDEMGHYRTQFEGQVVYCNCDDPEWSNFWRYFHSNFGSLKLKKLICTHYQQEAGAPSYALIYEGGDDFNMEAGYTVPIAGNGDYNAGDFRSDACIEFLKKSTIVTTNPPFSLFREYVAQLIKYEKKFIILGNQNASHNKDIFPLFKENKLWYGASIHSGGVDFRMPDDYEEYSDNVFIKNGHHYINLAGIRWFTNMDVKYRHDGLWHKNGEFDNTQAHCYYEGNEDRYPHYYNFNGIDVDSASNIPIDYTGYMGVPITILDKYNPSELEILGTGSDIEKTMTHMVTEEKKTIAYVRPDGSVAWSAPYTVSERKLGNGLRIMNANGLPGASPFSRIIVRNLHPISKADDKGF